MPVTATCFQQAQLWTGVGVSAAGEGARALSRLGLPPLPPRKKVLFGREAPTLQSALQHPAEVVG